MTAFTNGALEIEIVFPFIETSFKEDGGKLFGIRQLYMQFFFNVRSKL